LIWPDEARDWEPLAEALSARLPVLTLGEFDGAARCGRRTGSGASWTDQIPTHGPGDGPRCLHAGLRTRDSSAPSRTHGRDSAARRVAVSRRRLLPGQWQGLDHSGIPAIKHPRWIGASRWRPITRLVLRFDRLGSSSLLFPVDRLRAAAPLKAGSSTSFLLLTCRGSFWSGWTTRARSRPRVPKGSGLLSESGSVRSNRLDLVEDGPVKVAEYLANDRTARGTACGRGSRRPHRSIPISQTGCAALARLRRRRVKGSSIDSIHAAGERRAEAKLRVALAALRDVPPQQARRAWASSSRSTASGDRGCGNRLKMAPLAVAMEHLNAWRKRARGSRMG